jgi:fucose permease
MPNKKTSAFPVFLAFLAMGFGDAAGPFVSLAKEQFRLSNFAAQLVTFTGFLMFGVLSVPMGVFQDRKGKKTVLLLGLAVMLAGILIPAIAGLSTFPIFLVTILLLGAGATTLQVAGNPIMRDVSAEGKFSRNLSLGQFVKAIGSLSGPLIPVLALRWYGLGWQVIFPIYSVALLITLIACWTLKVDDPAGTGKNLATFGSSLAMLKNNYVAMMIIALFLYVGAEVSVSSGIPLYLQDRFQVDINKIGLLGTGLFFLALTIGRFSGGVLLNWMKPKIFFILTSILSVIGLLMMFLPLPTIATVGFFIIGFGFANIFPLIFSIVIDKMPEHSNALSGLMVMAIVGGAIVPPLMGLVADKLHSVQLSFIVPVMALVYITYTAFANLTEGAA